MSRQVILFFIIIFKNLNSETIRARELTFWELTHVMCHMSRFTFYMSPVICQLKESEIRPTDLISVLTVASGLPKCINLTKKCSAHCTAELQCRKDQNSMFVVWWPGHVWTVKWGETYNTNTIQEKSDCT